MKETTSDIIYRGVIDKFGHTTQTVIAIEELSELQKELTKMLRNKGNHEHLVEEIADVIIMLNQVLIMYNVRETELINEIKVKQERTARDVLKWM